MNEAAESWDFFLAYTRADEPSAQELYQHLAAHGKVFLDRRSLVPGRPWPEETQGALEATAAVVVLVSRRSNESWYLPEEIVRAIQLGKEILPVVLNTGDPLPYGLQRLTPIVAPEVGGMPGVARLLLARRGRPPAGDLAAPSRAATIPDDRRPLFGRERETEVLLESLEGPRRHRGIVSIDGLGGVGKTALAEEIVQRLRSAGPFAHLLWETAKTEVFNGAGVARAAAGPPVTLQRLLAVIAREGGFAEELEAQLTLTDKVYLARTYLERERYLVVVDNLETVAEYRRLISDIRPLFSFSQAIVTTRFSLAEYDFVRSIPLPGLPAEASLALLRHELAVRSPLRDFAPAEDDLLAIHRATGGLPLAMKLVIGRVLSSGAPLGTLLAQLRHVDWSDAQDVHQQLYRFIYDDVFALLTEPARDLLISLSVLPAEQEAPFDLVARVSGQSAPVFESALEELVRGSLLERSGSLSAPRFALHPLTRHFVARLSAGAG